MPSLVKPSRVPGLRRRFRDLEDTMEAVFWDVAFQVWKRTRPDGWKEGMAGEGWQQAASGAGRLRENRGSSGGGPIVGDGAIYQQAPYRLRCKVETFDAFRVPKEDGQSEHEIRTAWIVVGDRLFRVVAFAPLGGERQHATAYLTEVFDMELPTEPEEEEP